MDFVTIGASLVVAWFVFSVSSYLVKIILLQAPSERRRRLGVNMMKAMLIWFVSGMLVMSYIIGEGDLSWLLKLSPAFWVYLVSAIAGWYLGVWFGPRRAKLDV